MLQTSQNKKVGVSSTFFENIFDPGWPSSVLMFSINPANRPKLVIKRVIANTISFLKETPFILSPSKIYLPNLTRVHILYQNKRATQCDKVDSLLFLRTKPAAKQYNPTSSLPNLTFVSLTTRYRNSLHFIYILQYIYRENSE